MSGNKMAHVKFVGKEYCDASSVRNLINYCINPKATKNYVGYINLTPYCTVEELVKVSRYWGFENLDESKLIHIVISFSPYEFVSKDEALELGYEFARHYSDRFQMVFGVHTDTDNIHLHFAIGAISFIDGSEFPISHPKTTEFRRYVGQVMNGHE